MPESADQPAGAKLGSSLTRYLLVIGALLTLDLLEVVVHLVYGPGCWGLQPGGTGSQLVVVGLTATFIVASVMALTSAPAGAPLIKRIVAVALSAGLIVAIYVQQGWQIFTSIHNMGTENLVLPVALNIAAAWVVAAGLAKHRPSPEEKSAPAKPRSLPQRLLFSALRIIGVSYVLALLLLYFFQSRLVYMPYRELEGTPAGAGMGYEDVTLTAADGVRLHAWFVPALGEPRGTVLFCHGNAGNISHRIENLRKMRNLHLDALIFDYRGYGRSEGWPTEEGTYLDVRAAWDWLLQRKQVPPGRIVLWGQSLGGGVASHLAGDVSPAALILESTYTSVPDVGADTYPFLPVRWLARIRYDNVKNVRRISCPLLVVHSRQDELLRFAYAERIFAAAPEPKEFLEISGSHNEGFLTSGRTYTDGLDRFIGKHLKK